MYDWCTTAAHPSYLHFSDVNAFFRSIFMHAEALAARKTVCVTKFPGIVCRITSEAHMSCRNLPNTRHLPSTKFARTSMSIFVFPASRIEIAFGGRNHLHPHDTPYSTSEFYRRMFRLLRVLPDLGVEGFDQNVFSTRTSL